MGGWWWSKGILEFRFGPSLGLRLEAWTKLNNTDPGNSLPYIYVFVADLNSIITLISFWYSTKNSMFRPTGLDLTMIVVERKSFSEGG